MNRLLGVLLLTTGCTVLPESRTPTATTGTLPPAPRHAGRVGVEFLPAAQIPASAAHVEAAVSGDVADHAVLTAAGPSRRQPSVEIAHDVVPTVYRDEPHSPLESESLDPWDLSDRQLQEIRDPVQRFTTKFVDEVLGEDRRRVQRRLGIPLLSRQTWLATHPIARLRPDEDALEDDAVRLARELPGLLKAPLRSALRAATLAHDVELWFDDIKEESGFSLAALQEHRDRHEDQGRFAMRVHATDFNDPVELTYIRSGWRIGSGAERLELTYRHDMSETVSVGLRSHYRYADEQFDVQGDLLWRVNACTDMHVRAGNKVDTPFGGRSRSETRPTRSPGIAFAVEHRF